MSIRIVHPAESFRQKRVLLFSTAKKHGWDQAYYLLEQLKGRMNKNAYLGLKMEFLFMAEHELQLGLTPSLDCGDHCDFTGSYNGSSRARFDVTSSLTWKNLSDYEKEQQKGIPYYVALMNPTTGRLENIIDINFPRCEKCGGRLVNIVMLGGEEYQNSGTTFSTAQKTMTVCTNDFTHISNVQSFTSYATPLLPFKRELSEYHNSWENPSYYEEDEIRFAVRHAGFSNSLWFSKLSGQKIHACGEGFYKGSRKRGNHRRCTKISWRADIINKLLPHQIEEYLFDREDTTSTLIAGDIDCSELQRGQVWVRRSKPASNSGCKSHTMKD